MSAIPTQSIKAVESDSDDAECDQNCHPSGTSHSFRRVSSTSTKKAPETPSSEPLPTQNEDPNNAEGDSAISFASMSRIEWVTLILLSVITFADTVENSCISPFFPTEAEKKGMSSSEIGVIMGARQLIILIFSPVMGRFMANIGTKRMFIAGISIVGCTTITLGFMPHWPAGRPFFIIAIAVNIIEALGDTANSTASLAILAERFPGRLATLMGLFETIGGLGGMIGPLLGGFLLEKGGFELPFLLMGSIILGGAIISYWLISEVKDTGVDENKGMKAMMKLPMMWVMVYAMITSAVLLSFLDPTLGPHIQSMDISPTAMGAIFLLSSLAYTVTAPIWGYAIDKFKCTTHFIFAGSICVVPAMLLLGPSPILPLSKSIISITIGISILGVSMGAVHIPIFQQCLLTVKKYGFPDNAQTYGGVSGIYSAAVAFGGFLGPTLGGVSVDYIGFPWTTTMLSALIVIFIITLFLSYAAVGVHNRKIKRRQVVRPEPV